MACTASARNTMLPRLLQPSFFIDGSEPEDVTFTLGGRITAMDIWDNGPNCARIFSSVKPMGFRRNCTNHSRC